MFPWGSHGDATRELKLVNQIVNFMYLRGRCNTRSKLVYRVADSQRKMEDGKQADKRFREILENKTARMKSSQALPILRLGPATK